MRTGTDAWAVADPTVCEICGRDACEEHLPATASERRATARALTFTRASDLMAAPRPIVVVDGLAWAGCVTVLVSESGTGKTFVLLDLAAAVSADLTWHGRRVQHGSVAYLSFEGDALGLRLRALRDVQGQRLEHMYVLRASDPLSPRVTREGEEPSIGEGVVIDALTTLADELTATKRPPIVLVIIDTIRASLAGSEDSSDHTAAYLRAVRRIMARVPSAAAILAHHAGWQDGEQQKKRERGSSAWRGNCDATAFLEAGEYDHEHGEAPLTLRALKVRDAERPAPLHFMRRRVELSELDRHGERITSCIIEPDRRTREDREAEQAATTEAASRESDIQTLRIIHQQPEVATSQDRIRLALGARRDVVYASVARLIRWDWITVPGRQRQPYTLTPAGRQALSEAT